MWTDGSCPVPQGPGGYAAILLAYDNEGAVLKRREVVGGADVTTNNRMELQAVIAGLGALTKPARVRVYTDSRYVMDPIVEGWIEKWVARGWRKTANADLWPLLLVSLSTHHASFTHVYGHTGVPLNEEADRLAGKQTALRRERLRANVVRWTTSRPENPCST